MTPSRKAIEVRQRIINLTGEMPNYIDEEIDAIIQDAIEQATKEQMLDTVRLLASVFTNGKSILVGSPPPVEWTPRLLANVIARNLAESQARKI